MLMNILTITLTFLAACAVTTFADKDRSIEPVDIHKDAILQVKGYAIWFTTEQQLYVWQRFQRISRPTVVKAYKDILFKSRNAFQFNSKLAVRIVNYISTEHTVQVKILANNRRFDGANSIWWVDDKDVQNE